MERKIHYLCDNWDYLFGDAKLGVITKVPFLSKLMIYIVNFFRGKESPCWPCFSGKDTLVYALFFLFPFSFFFFLFYLFIFISFIFFIFGKRKPKREDNSSWIDDTTLPFLPPSLLLLISIFNFISIFFIVYYGRAIILHIKNRFFLLHPFEFNNN